VTLAAFIEVIDAFEMRVDVTRGEAAADGAVETHGHEVFGEAVPVLAHVAMKPPMMSGATPRENPTT
jgi:hypothetical protein